MQSGQKGVLYVVWGDVAQVLDRSIRSLKSVHPELPVHVCRLPEGASLLEKSRMFELSPFEETLYLDADTVVLRPLEFGFEKARRHGLACCIGECPWARRYASMDGDTVEYNTGVLFFTRKAGPLFERWKALAPVTESAIDYEFNGELRRMPLNDQASFARAMEETSTLPFILPLNWNFRPHFHRTWFGPIHVWHGYPDVNAELLKWNQNPVHDGRLMLEGVLDYPRSPVAQ